MPTLTEYPPQRPTFLEFLVVELAPREGRLAAVARIATGCVITVAIAMVFQIPQPTYMAYLVFVISKDEENATVTAALGALFGVTLAIVLTLGLSLVDTAEPALRLPLMAAATYAGMFTARTFALGPISFLAGFIIVLLQSMVDDVQSPEALTRATLWTWVVALVPVAVTVVVHLLSGRGVVKLIDRTIRGVLQELALSVADGAYRKHLPRWRARVAPLLETARHTATKVLRTGHITPPTIAALLDALVILEAFPAELPQALRRDLAKGVEVCLRALQTGGDPAEAREILVRPTSGGILTSQPPVLAFVDALTRFVGALDRPLSSTATPESPEPRRTFVADAFTNPAHRKFALKTTIAVMISYAAYTMLDWPGLRTALVTCFFVALSSLGETVHKLILRLSGAAIGGLLATLCIVFVLPRLTDIGQLCLLIAGVSLGAGWVATSSELLAYAGMQIAFAFFLGVLHGYAPATDLTVLRDRMVGIMLGNIATTLVFSSLWPESTTSGVRAALADTLRAISGVLGRTPHGEADRARAVQALVRADRFRALSRFELRMLPTHPAGAREIPPVACFERLAGAAFVASSAPMLPYTNRELTATYGGWAESAADDMLRHQPTANPPSLAQSQALPSLEPQALIAHRAMEQLESEALHVASAMH